MQHTDYNINNAGRGSRLQSTTSFYDTLASPSKHSTPQDPLLEEYVGTDLSWLDGPTLDEENSDSDSEEEDPDTTMDPHVLTEDGKVKQVSLF